MGRQLVTMRMGMGIVPGREGRFCLRMVGRVGMRMIQGVVLVLFDVALLVLAGMRGKMFLRPGDAWWFVR
jgi:hypothetical protein